MPSSDVPRYLLDTNVFISPKRTYGFQDCQKFWEWLIDMHQMGKVFSIKEVYDELQKPQEQDDLAQWAEGVKDQYEFFVEPDDSVLDQYGSVSKWAKANQNHTDGAASTFLGDPKLRDARVVSADPWLVAYALAHEYIVVTRETPGRYTTPNQEIHEIKIPDACAHFNIECIYPQEMRRREHADVKLDKFCTSGAARGGAAQ